MGNLGNLGFMGAKIKKIISEQNKISSTLFKISSEIKKFCSELFARFSGVLFRTSEHHEITDE